jgi:hypothetical protein
MRAKNPSPQRGAAVERGRADRGRAGPRGITFRDKSITAHPVVDLTVVGATLIDNDDGTALLVIDGFVTVVGEVSADGTAFTISSGADHRAFPGVAWLTDPTATEHRVGDKFLIAYRHGATHLTGGKIVAKIATVTDTVPWTYTMGSEFDIEDVANDLRGQGDSLSVLDIDGAGDYRAIYWCNEYDGTNNISPHLMICDDPSASMTSGSTWTRYNVGGSFSGHTQDAANGRVHQLANGTYMMAGQYVSGGVVTVVVLSSSDITDWSAPTMTTVVASGYNEADFEEVTDGTLYIHLRNAANTFHYGAVSTDSGATWSTPVQLYAATGYPVWRLLNSGIGLTVYRSAGGSLDTAWRQTPSGVTDTGWGSETILSALLAESAYATILQLDDNHALVIYAVESAEGDPVDADIYSQVFTDTSVVGSVTNLDDLTDVILTGSAVDDTLRFSGSVWVNDNRRWEPVTTNPGGGPELVWTGDDIVMTWRAY